jgi:hypothetical protein
MIRSADAAAAVTTESTHFSSSAPRPSAPSALEYDDCPICLSKFSVDDAVYQTDCAHCFCAECITKHLTGSSECPLCRGAVRNVALRKRAGVPLAEAWPLTATYSPGATSTSATPSATGSASSASPTRSAPAPMRRTSKDIVLVKARYNKHTYDVRAHTRPYRCATRVHCTMLSVCTCRADRAGLVRSPAAFLQIPLKRDCSFRQFRSTCGQLLSLDPKHIKIIHKGKLLSKETQDLLTDVLQRDPNPTFQLVASQQLPQGKWQQPEERSRCTIQ